MKFVILPDKFKIGDKTTLYVLNKQGNIAILFLYSIFGNHYAIHKRSEATYLQCSTCGNYVNDFYINEIGKIKIKLPYKKNKKFIINAKYKIECEICNFDITGLGVL